MFRRKTRQLPWIHWAIALWVVVATVEQTFGQSAGIEFVPNDQGVGWGMNSLYHVNRGVRGAASCATSTCHGGPKAGIASAVAPRGSEYPLWLESDPHARSWKTICSDTSNKILIKLGILKDGRIADMAGYRNCLACHNTEKNLGNDQMTPIVAEGVGCESCHGPSQPWFDRHYQGIESTQIAQHKLGLTNSRPLLQRAKICATCHVGGKDRDMNHDIIAAGHPALYFDMAVYHEAYPKHWRDPEQDSRDFRAKLWLAGQIAAADSELELMESRACKSLPISTWPELSIYQCSSCHSSLNGNPKVHQTVQGSPSIRGQAPVRELNLAGLLYFQVSATTTESDKEFSVKQLRSLLSSANPDSERVAAESQKLRVQLVEFLWDNGTLSLPDWSRQKQIELTLRRLEETQQSSSWESAAGAYAAAWATFPKLAQGKLENPMMTLRAGLLFSKNGMTPSFPRSETETMMPTLKEWDDSLMQVISVLKNEVR